MECSQADYTPLLVIILSRDFPVPVQDDADSVDIIRFIKQHLQTSFYHGKGNSVYPLIEYVMKPRGEEIVKKVVIDVESDVIIDIDDDDQLPQRPKPARIIDLTHKESKYKQTSLFTHLRPKRKSHLCIDSDSEEELTYEVDSKSQLLIPTHKTEHVESPQTQNTLEQIIESE